MNNGKNLKEKLHPGSFLPGKQYEIVKAVVEEGKTIFPYGPDIRNLEKKKVITCRVLNGEEVGIEVTDLGNHVYHLEVELRI